MKKSLIFYYEWLPLINSLPDESRLCFYDTILNPDRRNSDIQDPHLKAIIAFISSKVEENEDKYQQVIEKRRAAGAEGGKQKAANASKSQQVVASGSKSQQNLANLADNVNDNVNVNDKDNDLNKEKINKKEKVSLESLSISHISDWLKEKRSKGLYINHDETRVLEIFKDYCRSKGKKYLDYPAALRGAFDWDKCQPRQATKARNTHLDFDKQDYTKGTEGFNVV
jgi:hypothetical protein